MTAYCRVDDWLYIGISSGPNAWYRVRESIYLVLLAAVSQKGVTILLPATLPNANGFSNFFHGETRALIL